jgi:very-short-patch-repair endonuclease
MKVTYDSKLKEYARHLRNNSTNAEIKLWMQLKGKQMQGYDFHRQKPIGNYIADFFCNKLRLVIEIDGSTHDFDEVQQKDRNKQDFLNKLGITVLRFTNKEVMSSVFQVVQTIEDYIGEFEKENKINN